MNSDHFALLSNFISPTYLSQAASSRNSVSNQFTELLSQRRVPDAAWTPDTIELFIREVSLWDSNNFPSIACVGEREGRCLSSVVSRRHWGLTHGIGRSGDVNAEQPKAAGSSFLLNLTRILVRDTIKNVFGITNVPKQVVVLPVATGMSLMLGMTAVSQMHRDHNRRNVIWSRIDQKSCIKAMTSDPNLIVHVVEQKRVGDGLVTDTDRIESMIESLGASSVHSIVLTTSTFAPRTPDDIPAIARMCKEKNVPLVVNNAYGLQCSKCCHLINEALRTGRVDLVVQSTDKNLAVPVGGSILFGPLAERVNQIYPGRASMSPILDVLITLLETGRTKLAQLVKDRKDNFAYLQQQVSAIPNVTVLSTPKNQISISLTTNPGSMMDEKLGSELFLRNVSGARVFVRSDKSKTIDEGIPGLVNFGCHSDVPVVDRYLNAACAIGTTKDEIDVFVSRLTTLLSRRDTV